jgi:hypothetical protein
MSMEVTSPHSQRQCRSVRPFLEETKGIALLLPRGEKVGMRGDGHCDTRLRYRIVVTPPIPLPFGEREKGGAPYAIALPASGERRAAWPYGIALPNAGLDPITQIRLRTK